MKNSVKASGKMRTMVRVAVCCVMWSGAVYGQQVIDLRHYGVKPDSYENASPAIVRAIAAAAKYDEVIIRFPGGRIDLWPEGAKRREYYVTNATEDDTLSKVKTIGILLENKSNITLEGNGTLLVAHGKMVHLAIDHSRNIRVKGLRFDYERPTMSEMTVTAVSKETVEARVHRDSRYAISDGRLVWYGEGWKAKDHHVIRYVPEKEAMFYSSWKPFKESKAEELSPNHIRFTGDFSDLTLAEQDVLTIRDPYRDCLGVLNYYSHQVTFDDIRLHYMHGMGIVSQYAEDITLNNVQVNPRESSGRVIAAFADCFHFSGCYGKIKIENCHTSGSHDDPVNVHGTHLRIVESKENTLKVRFMHHQTWNFEAFQPGDSIGYVDNETLLLYDYAVVKEVNTISEREIVLALDRPVSKGIQEKHCIENISKTPEVIIRNNRFERTNTRGVLLTTRKKALIENNTFYRTGMHAILIANDCNFWYESGPVKDVTIRNNTFIECGYNSAPNNYVIAIMPETHTFEKGGYVHSNISISENEFKLFDTPVLFARSTENLTFEGNRVSYSRSKFFPENQRPMFYMEHCDKVVLNENQIEEGAPNQKVMLKNTGKRNIKVEGKAGYQLVLE